MAESLGSLDGSQRISDVLTVLGSGQSQAYTDFIMAHPEVEEALGMLVDETKTFEDIARVVPMLRNFDERMACSVLDVLRGAILKDVTITELMSELSLAIPGLTGFDSALREAVVVGDMRSILKFIPASKKFMAVIALRHVHNSYANSMKAKKE